LIEIFRNVTDQFLPIGGLLTTLFAIVSFLDWKLKDEIKLNLLNAVYGPTQRSRSWAGELPSYYSAIYSLFGLKGISSFLPRSILATIAMLAVLSFLQATINNRGFSEDTIPFFVRVLAFDSRAIIPFVGVLIIDLISIYQTSTFLRISRGCQNFWEVLFLSIADVLMSVLLFIVLFPLFVAISFFVNVPRNKTFSVLISSSVTKQNPSYADLRSFLLFDPRSKDQTPEGVVANLLERKWHFRSYDVYANAGTPDPKPLEILKHSSTTGNILVQTRGNLTDQKVIDILARILKERPYIKSLSLVDSTQSFYSAYASLRLSVDNSVAFAFFGRTYGGLVRQINFLDADLLRVLSLRSPQLTGNDVAFQYNLKTVSSRLLREDREQYVYCDGKSHVTLRSAPLDPATDFDKCEEAVAVDSIAFGNIRSLTLYEEASEAIPISPLALSSLTATIVIYYLLLSKIAFRAVRPVFIAAIRDGDKLLRRHLLTITLVCGVLLASPLLAIVWVFVRL
jgi:hypothetical protein